MECYGDEDYSFKQVIRKGDLNQDLKKVNVWIFEGRVCQTEESDCEGSEVGVYLCLHTSRTTAGDSGLEWSAWR